MAGLAGKTLALIILVLLILSLGYLMGPLLLAPLGVFTGVARGFKEIGISSFHFRPWAIFYPLSFSLLFFIIWIFVVVWVYRDAERRGMNGVLWALLVFIGNLIGLVIYLIMRQENLRPSVQEKSLTKLCPNCQKSVTQNFAFCPHCGKSLQPVCRACGKPVEAAWKVCPHCGEKLKAEE
jgi:RNA polymerase subunit RPABC4/transcription elongation factor Spt4